MTNHGLDSQAQISFLYVNPKRAGCSAHALYEVYKKAKTVEEALDLGCRNGDLCNERKKGFLFVHDCSCEHCAPNRNPRPLAIRDADEDRPIIALRDEKLAEQHRQQKKDKAAACSSPSGKQKPAGPSKSSPSPPVSIPMKKEVVVKVKIEPTANEASSSSRVAAPSA